MEVEAKLVELGLELPEPLKPPSGLVRPFSWVKARGDRAYVSGHVPLNPDGSIAHPLGKVGAEVSEEQAYEAARLTALAVLGSLKRALGDLDRVVAWVRVFGMVNTAPGFDKQPNVINGFSDLILELYGAARPEIMRALRWAWQGCLWAPRWRSRPRSRYSVASGDRREGSVKTRTMKTAKATLYRIC